jgi:hypothetical protein
MAPSWGRMRGHSLHSLHSLHAIAAILPSSPAAPRLTSPADLAGVAHICSRFLPDSSRIPPGFLLHRV